MQCFFVDPGAKQLFAALAEPRRASAANVAVLLCYPFGQEYMRAHRSYRQLANLLARGGLPTLRFDYGGSGDSYDPVAPLRFADLLDDAGRALDALKQKTAASTIYVVGLRLGALVAASLANQRSDVSGVFLWDAFADGAALLADAERQSEQAADAEGSWWLHGYELGKPLRDDLANVDLNTLALAEVEHLVHVISGPSEDSARLQKAFSGRLQERLIASNGDWNFVDMQGSILMPAELVRGLSRELLDVASAPTREGLA